MMTENPYDSRHLVRNGIVKVVLQDGTEIKVVGPGESSLKSDRNRQLWDRTKVDLGNNETLAVFVRTHLERTKVITDPYASVRAEVYIDNNQVRGFVESIDDGGSVQDHQRGFSTDGFQPRFTIVHEAGAGSKV